MPNDKETVRVDRPGSLHLAGDGLCEEVCPELFFGADDGLFYVKDKEEKANPANPRLRMGNGLAYVPDNLIDSAVDAAEECPGECIFFTEVE